MTDRLIVRWLSRRCVLIVVGVADREALLKRFSTEARSAGRCVHPNIVTVFDYIGADDTPYIVMEFVDAGTLENVVNPGRCSLHQVGEIMVQLVSALAHAHAKGIVHRDVKPSNISVQRLGFDRRRGFRRCALRCNEPD